MQIRQHVFNTWLLAQAIHPLVFSLWVQLEGSYIAGDEQLSLVLMAFIFSTPAFLVCLMVLKPIICLFEKTRTRLIVWIMAAICAILATTFLLAALFGGAHFFFDLFDLIAPGCIAAVLAIIIRAAYFFRLVNEFDRHYENA